MTSLSGGKVGGCLVQGASEETTVLLLQVTLEKKAPKWPPQWIKHPAVTPKLPLRRLKRPAEFLRVKMGDSPFLYSALKDFPLHRWVTWATQVFSGRPRGKVASTRRPHTRNTRDVSSPSDCTTTVVSFSYSKKINKSTLKYQLQVCEVDLK